MGIASSILAAKEAQAKQAGFTIAKLGGDNRALLGTLAGLGAAAGAGYLGYEHRDDLGRAYGALTHDKYVSPAAADSQAAELSQLQTEHAANMAKANNTFQDLSSAAEAAKDRENDAWHQLSVTSEYPDRLKANLAQQQYNSQFTPDNPMFKAQPDGWHGVPGVRELLDFNDRAGNTIQSWIPQAPEALGGPARHQ